MKPAILACAIAVACGRDSEKAPVASASPVAAPSVAPAGIETASACPHTGRWAICNVEQRLRQAGFVAKRTGGESPKRAGFSVTPVVYTLGRSRLEVFIYDDEAALARDVAKLDTVSVSPPGVVPSWDGTPVFIRSGNLVAVLIGDNPRQAERLALALTAGAPQPGSPR
jgi:hypothetical protein